MTKETNQRDQRDTTRATKNAPGVHGWMQRRSTWTNGTAHHRSLLLHESTVCTYDIVVGWNSR